LAHDDNIELPIGFDTRRAIATGLPLMPDFSKPIDSAMARRILCLRSDIPVILILGGGLGLGVDVIAERLLHAHTPMQLLVLKGRNMEVSEKLTTLAAQSPERIKVFDWTERTDVFIRAADLVVGKPGGLTVAEVLACGRPLLMTRSLRGQEDYNVRFITKQQVGALVSNAELVEQVDHLLAQPATLAALTTRAWQVGRRNGAAHIAGQILVKAAARNRHGTHQAWQFDCERWNDNSVG
jgi:processive 1,2-diacylglycerol beta-glucosyltransferase